MFSKNNQHIKLWIVLLLIIPIFYSFGPKTDVNAFKIGISENTLSSLNFNSVMDKEVDNNLSWDLSSTISDYSQPGVGIPSTEDEIIEEENGEMDSSAETSSNNVNQDGVSKYVTNFLPLIKDYTDIPSSLGTSSETAQDKVIPNQYIVVLKSHKTDISDFFSQISSKINLKDVDLLQRYESVLNGFAIHVPNEKIIDIIRKSPLVAYVEKDVTIQAFAQTMPTGINRIDADLSPARSGDGSGSINIDIAIIDSGIDLDHSDLNVYHQKTFVSGTGSSSADDDNGHGTHVAGIAAAKDNTIGTVGVAPGAKLWAIKVLDSKGSGPLSTVIKGIDYVTQHANEIEVANLSLGCECKSSAFDTAINNAVNAGIVFVVAAGNGAKDAHTFSPANNPNVIAVSAIGDSDGKCGGSGPTTGFGNDDTLASFSNYGSEVDIAAPGTKIYSTYKSNSYATMSGTSVASPHVAGAAALYLADNPSLSPSEVRNAMLSHGSLSEITCDGKGNGYFTGDKDQFREPLLYVRNFGETTNPSSSSPPTANAGSDRTVDGGAKVQLDGSGSSDPKNSPLTFAWTQTSGPSVALSDSSSARPTFTAPQTSAKTDLVFKLEVTNNDGVTSDPDSVKITVNPLNKPTANAGSDLTVDSGAKVQLDGSGSSDPKNSPLTFAWTQTSGPSVALSDSSSARPTFTAPQTTSNNIVLKFQLVVTNDLGVASEPDVLTITVKPVTNNNPNNSNGICSLLGSRSDMRGFFGC
jgi:subtilisin family serine protease